MKRGTYIRTPEIIEKNRLSKKGKCLGENNPNWRGGKFKRWQGYILIKNDNHPYKNNKGYIFEHRLVLEKKLGRYLNPWEIIHHINGIKSDNRIENLQICNSNAEHFAIHKILRKNGTRN